MVLQRTYLNSGWEFAEKTWPGGKIATVETGWLPAQVPGHVHLDLIANGVIADPFVRMNELGCQWVDRADWCYRTSFEWSPTPDCPKRILRFEGLDTVCSVYLNGDLVAEHDNMFVPLEIDVSETLVEGQNELRVDFQSAVRVGEERRDAYFGANAIKPDVMNFPERAFVRKAQYMFGWDWGPRLVSCGIWKPVCLVEYEARISDVHVTHVALDGDRFRLDVEIESEGPYVPKTYLFYGGSEEAEPVAGNRCSFEIENPYPWREGTTGLGWDVIVRSFLVGSDEDGVIVGESLAESSGVLDLRDVRCGCSTTRLVREPDSYGESFEFEVDGRKIWARGANWIPDHSFPSIIDRSRLRDRLEKAKDMGFNMLRVWGGGLYESDDFYDLCDELGILVWQDFPFACSFYPDDEKWQDFIRVEAEANIKRLRNHPCLALWCGNNENLEMYENAWGGADHRPDRYYGENHYDKVLPRVVSEFDQGRSYIPTSPVGEPPAGAEVVDQKRRGPNSDGYGDQHNWDAWHGRGDWRFYSDSKGRFSSEYGFASSCSASVWEKTLAPEDWDPHSAVVKWHDRTAKGHETFHGFVKLHYPESQTLEDWVYYSQLNQRDALRYGVEHYRRSQFCAGSLIWQLNDCWPVQSWSILDSDGNYKALAYELRRLYADRMLSIERHSEKVKVWYIDQSEEPDTSLASMASLAAISLANGEVLRRWDAQDSGELRSGAIQLALEADVSGLATPETILVASCYGVEDSWQLLGEPKNARFGSAKPILASAATEGYLTLRLDSPVVDLMLTVDGDPMWFQDNFITSAGGVVEIACAEMPASIEARSLAGFHEIRFTRSPI